jgi:predicted transcriptional regulator YdeE
MAEPVLKKMEAFRVAGFSVRTLNEREMEPETAKIPGLWQRVLSGELSGLLKPAEGASLYAVYSDYEGDHTQPYTLTVGFQIDNSTAAPEGTNAVDMPEQSYLVFTASGEPPQSIIDAWGDIWTFFDGNPDYARAYTYDFERYGDPGQDTEIYIAVSEAAG